METIADLWRAGDPEATQYLAERGDGWVEVSRADALRRIDELANGLLALGLRKGEVVAILGRTSLEWALTDFALARIGAVSVGLYVDSPPAEQAYVIGHSDAVAAFAEDPDALPAEARGRLRHVLAFAELDDLAARGRAYAAESPGALEAAAVAVKPDDLYTIIYTSGTTGPPKGCLIPHRNFVAIVSVVDELRGLIVEDDTVLLYLPLAHNFGRVVHLAAPAIGFTLAFCADPLRAGHAALAVRPTVFPSVPLAWEKVHAAATAHVRRATGARGAIARWAVRVGARASERLQAGKRVPLHLKPSYALADKLVYSKVRERVGGRLRLALSGGAPLSAQIARDLHALGILVLEGYGISEATSAASVNLPDHFRFGTVGPPLPGVEFRIDDDGEILLRSETVMRGYLKDDEATRATITEDGWLRTGDVGELEDGFLRITDRKKDLIVTASGENVAPQNIENALKGAPVISQALVLGDRRAHLGALITVDRDAVGDGDAQALVQAVVDGVNEGRPRHEQVRRFAILDHDFSQADGEVTPTLKLRRRVIEEHYADVIAGLFR
ncbi:MAG: long-chain fatty acid--CoA ligase [Actinobacteria bacterium]|nr:long-chain fatty acid--CoA ligase [Actinomycetota bacterium]